LTHGMKIGLYGSAGHIGSAFVAALERRGVEWVNLKETHPQEHNLSAIINCMAFICKPSVEANDDHKCSTILGNVVLPAQLTSLAAAHGLPLAHISTGCLWFDPPATNSQSPSTYRKFDEEDEPDLTFDTGAGWYVGSKELAERVVRQYEKHWICRIRLPFDNVDGPRNYLSKLLSFERVVDVRNSMTHRGDFVNACLDMIEKGVPFGTYNMTAPGAMWTHDIMEQLCRFGLRTAWKTWPAQDFMKTHRRTPMSVCELDCSKLLAAGIKMRPVQEAVEDSIRNWRSQ
jgi:3,5-epimerase/4-reductase